MQKQIIDNGTLMTRIGRILADIKKGFRFRFIHVNPFRSDLIRVPLLFLLFGP
jgi:hypothetical protein